MFDKSSRYYTCEIAALTVTDPNGTRREVRYARRRFIPQDDEMSVVLEHSFAQGERLDSIAARYLGDPAQFWRICDANGVMCAEELEVAGRALRISLPGLKG
jgi:hypothetical protein